MIKRSKPELVEPPGILMVAAGGSILLALVGLVLGIALDLFGVHLNGSSSFNMMVHGLWVGAVVGVIACIFTNLLRKYEIEDFERAEREERAVEQAAMKQRAEEEHRNRVSSLTLQIKDCYEESITLFAMLPDDLKIAHDWLMAGRQHFENNAYSPFWQSVENAYSSLGHFNARIIRIDALARKYAGVVNEYEQINGEGIPPKFPVQVDSASATRAYGSIVQIANRIVYQAQCEPVFAQIWEQRRTTAAVVRGFATLEQAVSGMASALQMAVDSLTSNVGSHGSNRGSTDPRVVRAVNQLQAESW